MKKKYLMLIPLTFLTFSCANIFKFGRNTSSSGSDSGTPTDVDGNPSDGEGIEPIDNNPVHSYQPATVEAIHAMAETIAQLYNMNVDDLALKIETYFLQLGIGDALAVKICQTFDKNYMTFSQTTIESITAAQYKQYYYDILTILSSLDFSKVADLLEYFNNLYIDQYKAELNNLTLRSMFPLGYNDYTLDKIATAYDDPEFLSVYNSMKIDENIDIVYTSSQIDSYNCRREELQRNIDNGYIPQTVITFVRDNGKREKNVIINNLKTIVDNLVDPGIEFLKDYYQYTQSNSTSSSQETHHYFDLDLYQTGPGESAQYSYNCLNGSLLSREGEGVDSSSSSSLLILYQKLFKTLNKNKKAIKNVLTTLLDAGESSELFLDALRDVIFPVYFSRIPTSDPEVIQARQQFTNKLNALSAKHLNAIANFICGVIDYMDFTDIEYLLTGINSDESKAAISRFMTNLKSLISRTSGTDKSLILEVSRLFGLDILSELNTVANYFINRNSYSDEEFAQLLSGWSRSLYESFSESFTILFRVEEHSSSGSSSNYNEYYDWNIPNTFVQNQSVTQSDVYLYYHDYTNSSIHLSGDLQYLQTNGSITIDAFSIDTSRIGFITPTISVTIVANGRKLAYTNTTKVLPEGCVLYNNYYIDSNDSGSTNDYVNYQYDRYFTIVSQNASLYVFDYDAYQQINIDTSTTGFHHLIGSRNFVVYYVAPLSSFETTTSTMALGVLEAQEMIRGAEIQRFIDVPSLGRVYSGYRSIRIENFATVDYSLGLHTAVDPVSGTTVEYMIVSLTDAYYVSESVYAGALVPHFYKALGMSIPSGVPEVFTQNMPSSLAVNVRYSYHFEINISGKYTWGSYSYSDVKAMTNIAVAANTFSFRLDGTQYSYTINQNALRPLSEIDFN